MTAFATGTYAWDENSDPNVYRYPAGPVTDPNDLPCEGLAEVDLPLADADAPAAGDANGAVVEGVFGLGRRLIGAGVRVCDSR